MVKALRAAVALVAVFFLVNAITWLVSPADAAAQLGMTLLNGAGLATQIGDLTSFFFTLGVCLLMGLLTGNTTWFYPATLLLGIAALARIVAWLLHDAALTIDMIVFEAVVAGIILFSARKLAGADA